MIDDKMLTVALGHVGKWAALAEEWQTKYEEAVARAEAAEKEVKVLLADIKRIVEARDDDCDELARQRDEAFTASAEAMREALFSKVDFSEAGFFDYVSHGTIRALAIPAQEVK